MKLLYWMSLTTFAVRKGMVNKNDFEFIKAKRTRGAEYTDEITNMDRLASGLRPAYRYGEFRKYKQYAVCRIGSKGFWDV